MNKHIAIIVSGGRTGTRFFGDLLSEVIENSYSVHEPDLFEGLTGRTWQRLKTFGFYHMVVGRLFGQTGIRNLSQKFLSGVIDLNDLADAVRHQRFRYYASLDSPFIIESYYQWYGILPVLPQVFPRYKVIGIVRDPRTWASSWMNFGGHHESRDLVARLGFLRLTPEMVGNIEFVARWPSMSTFEKLCWDWKTIYGLISEFVENDMNSRIYRYEDLFLEPSGSTKVRDMLDFLTDFPDRTFRYNLDDSLLRTPVHASDRDNFPDWAEWDNTLSRQLNAICGPLMKRFGYGNESTWHDLLRG